MNFLWLLYLFQDKESNIDFWRTKNEQKEHNNEKYFTNYNKVDHEEATLSFWQEIYDETGILVEIHEKYPLDKGHKKIEKP